jgi:hypothetical protein
MKEVIFLKYVAGSKSFRSDQLFKVTEIKQFCLFFNIASLYFNTLFTSVNYLTTDGIISLTEFSICRGFFMSGRNHLDPTAYELPYLP